MALDNELKGASKVLVVTDRFPATGGSRIDKFVKYLPSSNIEPIVISAKETDSALSSDIKKRFYPDGLRTYHAASIGSSYFMERFLHRGTTAQYYRLLSILSFPERCVLVPDQMIRWIPLGVRLAKKIVLKEKIDTVLTSSPPESTHLIGMALKQKYGIRWVADFRDLWTEKKLLYRPPTRFHDVWVRHLERKIFENADHIIANTSENADRYIERFEISQERLTMIPNGYDKDDFMLNRDKRSLKDGIFSIGYAGALDKHDFPWKIALDALNQLASKVGRDKVRFVHCGYLSKQVQNHLVANKIQDLVVSHGTLSHVDAMRITANTDIRLLLLYENAYSNSIVPMKLYNYLIMDGPILAIAPEEGATASIINQSRMGNVISQSLGTEAVYKQLLNYYQAWSRGVLKVAPNKEEIEKYDRRIQTQQLAEILTGVGV